MTGLIVDDAAIMRMRLREILEPHCSIIVEAEDGVQAMEMYAQHDPDFVTLDISMPRQNGMETIEQMMSRFSEPRIVVVSAVGQQKLVLDALKMGAKDFVVKPFEADRVLKAVSRAVGIAVA